MIGLLSFIAAIVAIFILFNLMAMIGYILDDSGIINLLSFTDLHITHESQFDKDITSGLYNQLDEQIEQKWEFIGKVKTASKNLHKAGLTEDEIASLFEKDYKDELLIAKVSPLTYELSKLAIEEKEALETAEEEARDLLDIRSEDITYVREECQKLEELVKETALENVYAYSDYNEELGIALEFKFGNHQILKGNPSPYSLTTIFRDAKEEDLKEKSITMLSNVELNTITELVPSLRKNVLKHLKERITRAQELETQSKQT